MWFFNKNKKKKYISCDLIEHGMDFYVNSINFCCRIPPSDKGYKKVIDNFHGEILDWKKFFSIKRKYREQMKKGNIIPECRNCIYLQEKEWDNEDYISFINFNNWVKCNAFCCYCSIHEDFPPTFKQYDVYPVIKDLADKGYLRKGGHITIAGGEPCASPEFNDLLNIFLENDFQAIRVLTNASVYSPIVEKGIKSGNINILVSVDSGTKEMFLKVKGYDFYEKVWGNIKRYASAQPFSDRVKTKYIVVPNVNDTKEEIDAWISKSIEVGVKHLALDLEMIYYDKNKDNLPPYLFDLFEYAIKRISERSLALELIDRGVIISNKLKSENRI